MKVQVAVSLCVLAIFSAAFFFRNTSERQQVPLEVVQAYSRWVQEHGKLYATPSERDYRLTVFYDQWLSVEQDNREYEIAAAAAGQTLTGPMFAINGFSDLTVEEFKARYTGAMLPEELEESEEEPVQTEAQEPVVSEVQSLSASNLGAGYTIKIRQQGSCGSCWAFSTVAALEKYHFDKTQSRVDFSQQELVDCEKGSGGCNGGYVNKALTYASSNGLAPSSKYPYTGSNGACKASTSNAVKIGSGSNSSGYSQQKAISAAGKGVHAAVSVYSSGKFYRLANSKDAYDPKLAGDCGKTIDHFVNIASASGDTVRIFNSWGTGWGEGGYKTVKICSDTNFIGSGYSSIFLP